MQSIPDRLRDQNNGEAWLDCNGRRLPHRWRFAHAVGDAAYWQCQRCPVSTRTARPRISPKAILPNIGGRP